MIPPIILGRVGSPLSGWVRHPYRVGLPLLTDGCISQLLGNPQMSMTYQITSEFHGQPISWAIEVIWTSLIWSQWLLNYRVPFPDQSLYWAGSAYHLIWRPMGHPISQKSSVSKLFLFSYGPVWCKLLFRCIGLISLWFGSFWVEYGALVWLWNLIGKFEAWLIFWE